MKWLIHGVGLIVSSALLTALSMSGISSSFSGAGFGILTVVVYFFGVFYFPRCIIRRAEVKRASAPPAESASEDAVPVKREPKRRPCRPDVVGYQFAVAVLICLLVACALNVGSKSSEIDRLRAELEDSYHNGYEDGYSEGESHGYSIGYDNGVSDGSEYGYASGYAERNSELGGIHIPEQTFSEWSNSRH